MSAESNIAYAISAICAPFVLDYVDESRLPTHQSLVHSDGWSDFAFQQLDAKPVRVGFAGFVHVAVAANGDTRRCEITSAQANPEEMRNAALRALATRPEGFAPTKSHYFPGPFATEDQLCTGAGSPHPGGYVMLSAAHPEQKDRVAVLFTMLEAPTRGRECDQDGVPMNYRTLAPS